MSAVTLPRSTVLKLLHLAQLGNGSGFIVRLRDGGLGIRAIQSGTARMELEQELKTRGETPFAFYRTALQTGPETADIKQWSAIAPMFLSVSVGTKGVLQLRGWQARDGATYPLELSLAEEDTVQSSGVPR